MCLLDFSWPLHAFEGPTSFLTFLFVYFSFGAGGNWPVNKKEIL
jgi:hypothetical protein